MSTLSLTPSPSITFDPPRPLTPAERDLLDFLIAANPRHRAKLRALLHDTLVWKECTGCGSIDLTTDPHAVKERTWPSPLPVTAVSEVDAVSKDGTPYRAYHFQAMLFAAPDGADIEIGLCGTVPRRPLPPKSQLEAQSNQWIRARDERGSYWENEETGQRRYVKERPQDQLLTVDDQTH